MVSPPVRAPGLAAQDGVMGGIVNLGRMTLRA
jgi:hypothetical protein